MRELAGFQLWLAQKGRKPRTIRLASYCITRVLRSVHSLTSDSVVSYLFSLQKQGKRNSYVNGFINALRLWGQYDNNPVLARLRFLPDQPFVKATMSDGEIESFLALSCPTCRHVSRHGTVTYRPTDPSGWSIMTMFFRIMAFSGMRCGEVAGLTIDAVDFGRQVFVLEDTKTNEPRFVPIAPNIYNSLYTYIGNLKTQRLFPSRRSPCGVINDTDWGYHFHRRLTIMGLKRKNLTPYSLRHSFCTRLLESDINLFLTQKIMGHKQLATTLQYSHLTTTDIIEAVKKHPLIRKFTDPIDILRSISSTIKNFSLEKDKRFTFVLKESNKSIRIEVSIVPDCK